MNAGDKMISVAMSTYNGEKYVIAQLRSIYEQNIRPDEVVIVDDCSKDHTVSLIRNWIEDKTEICWRIYQNKTNQGYIKNFFKSISLTNGDIIILCDQDDLWEKDKIQEIINVFQNPDVLSYHSEIDIIDQDGTVIRRHAIGYTRYNVPYSTYDFLRRLNYCGMSSAFRATLKDDLKRIDPEKIPTHDWIIHALASVKGGLYVSNKVTSYRRYHVDNAALIMEKPKREKMAQRLKVIENYYQYYRLYLTLNKMFGNGDPEILHTVQQYLKVTSERLEYLKQKNLIGFIKKAGSTRYYSSTKAYLCDFLYMIGIF